MAAANSGIPSNSDLAKVTIQAPFDLYFPVSEVIEGDLPEGIDPEQYLCIPNRDDSGSCWVRRGLLCDSHPIALKMGKLPNDTIAKINNTVSSKFLKTYRGDSDVRSLKAKTDDMKSGEVKRLQKEKASYLNKINQLQSEIDILRREVDTRAEESHRWIDVVERLEATNIRLAQEVTRYISEADKIERDAVKDKNEMASRIMASQSKIEEGIIDETNLRSLFNELASLIRSCVNSTIFHLNGKIDDFKSRFGEEYGVKMMGILFAVITDKVGNLFTFMAAKWSHHPDKTLHYIAIDRKIVDIIYTIRHLAPESRTRIWLLSSKKELGNDDISDIEHPYSKLLARYFSWRSESTWLQEVWSAQIGDHWTNQENIDSLTGDIINALILALNEPSTNWTPAFRNIQPLLLNLEEDPGFGKKLARQISSCVKKAWALESSMRKGHCLYMYKGSGNCELKEGETEIIDEQKQLVENANSVKKLSDVAFLVIPALIRYGNQRSTSFHIKTYIAPEKIGIELLRRQEPESQGLISRAKSRLQRRLTTPSGSLLATYGSSQRQDDVHEESNEANPIQESITPIDEIDDRRSLEDENFGEDVNNV